MTTDHEKFDIVILSDLHLGPGRNPETGRWSRLEDFFYDRELTAFLEHARTTAEESGRPLRLILNGDVFDFLAVTEHPTRKQSRELGLRLSRHERKFGMRPTPRASKWKIQRILKGHRSVLQALAALLADGNEVIIISGNHDPELFFASVQDAIVDEILEAARMDRDDLDEEALKNRICFRLWYWYEPGRVFVEHGHQYDESNVVPHLLYPIDPRHEKGEDQEIDLPVGSLLVRYLHNGLKRSNPYIRNYISLDEYMRFLGAQDLWRVLPQAVRNAKFLLRALREAPLFSGPRVQLVRQFHWQLREELGKQEGTLEILEQLEDRWPVQTAHTKARIVKNIVVPAVRQVALAAMAFMLTIYCWALMFNLIQTVPWLAEGLFAKAGWLAIFAVLTFFAVALVFRSLSRLLKNRKDVTFASLARAADKTASLLDVPNVSMGHSHLADVRRTSSGATYINTGTWTALQGPWDQIQPRSLMFTFARLDPEGFHLLRWDYSSREEVAVSLFEEPPKRLLERILPKEAAEPPEVVRLPEDR